MRNARLSLDLNDLAVDSFGTTPERGVDGPAAQEESRVVYTVYVYVETQQLTCHTGCGTCGGTDCWV